MAFGLNRRSMRIILVALVAGVAAWNFGAGVYILAKAELAQVLMEGAWARTKGGAERQRPWGWADTWPVARLEAERHAEQLIVLEGASGRNLAFGPAHVSATPLPGARGNSVIVGHRDTHFAWLKQVEVGDEIVLDTANQTYTYAVSAFGVVHETELAVMDDRGVPSLTLITCYPFDALAPGTPLRYVVTSELRRAHPS